MAAALPAFSQRHPQSALGKQLRSSWSYPERRQNKKERKGVCVVQRALALTSQLALAPTATLTLTWRFCSRAARALVSVRFRTLCTPNASGQRPHTSRTTRQATDDVQLNAHAHSRITAISIWSKLSSLLLALLFLCVVATCGIEIKEQLNFPYIHTHARTYYSNSNRIGLKTFWTSSHIVFFFCRHTCATVLFCVKVCVCARVRVYAVIFFFVFVYSCELC